MAVHVVWPCGRKEGKLARCPAPHFEAWELDSGAKVTGRIKMAEGSVRRLKNFNIELREVTFGTHLRKHLR